MPQTSAAEPQAISTEEAAKRLNLHVETIRRMVRRGELPAVKVGTRVRVPVSVIDALLNGEQPRNEVVPDDR